MTAACEHESFDATLCVNRLSSGEGGPITSYNAEIRVCCADCGEPFQWIGAPVGMSPRAPASSLDGIELRAPLRPVSAPAGWGEDGPAFHIGIRL